MTEKEREELIELNRELLVCNEIYNELIAKIGIIEKKIFEMVKKINAKLDGE